MTTSISRSFPEQAIFQNVNSQNTYLQRCTEELTRADKICKKFDQKATAYKVAAYALIGLCIAAAAAASILVGIYFSPFLPVVGITALSLAQPAFVYIKKIFALAKAQELLAKRTHSIAEEYQRIQANPEETQRDIEVLSIRPLNPDLDYKPLLANYNYWNELWSEKEGLLQKKLAEAKKTKLQDRIPLYIEAAALRHEINAAKVSQASLIAIVNNPEFSGTPQDLAYIKSHEWAQDALLRDFEDGDGAEYLVFNNPDISPLTFKQVKMMSPDQLSLVFDQAIRGRFSEVEEAVS